MLYVGRNKFFMLIHQRMIISTVNAAWTTSGTSGADLLISNTKQTELIISISFYLRQQQHYLTISSAIEMIYRCPTI